MPSRLPELQTRWNLVKDRMDISEMEWVPMNDKTAIETRKKNYPTEPLN